jgi:thioredoxin 1
MEPVVKEVAQTHSGKLRVVKIDTDKNPGASAHYGVQGIPTFILFKQGKIVWRQSGAVPKHVLESALKPHLA